MQGWRGPVVAPRARLLPGLHSRAIMPPSNPILIHGLRSPMRQLAILLAVSSPLVAQSVVVPNANATVSATTLLNNVVRETGMPRSYMLGINASELSAIPLGSLINGIS